MPAHRVTRYALLTALCAAIAAIPALAQAAPPAGNSIATATPLAFGELESGGGQGTDFWKVSLQGGDKIIFDATFPGNIDNVYSVDLYAPSVTDFTYFQTEPVVQEQYIYGTTQVILQAPRAGDYTLAVCEGGESTCSDEEQFEIDATNPMEPYTFTATLKQPAPVRHCTTKRVRRHHRVVRVRVCHG